jgi:hypothetical protein
MRAEVLWTSAHIARSSRRKARRNSKKLHRRSVKHSRLPIHICSRLIIRDRLVQRVCFREQSRPRVPPRCVLYSLFCFSVPKCRTAKLRGSKWEADVEHIRECFDKTAKLRFRGTEQWSFIKFGRPGDRDADHNIAGGQLKLSRRVTSVQMHSMITIILKRVAVEML